MQGTSLGLDAITPRSEVQLEGMGRLKWGIGKLIAHSAVCPIVIPMHHSGMPHVMPQHNVWRENDGNRWYDNRPKSLIPRLGRSVTVRFGECVSFDDLIKEHEAKHGALRKVSCRPEDLKESWRIWISTTKAERDLYSAITMRVQEALLRLEREANNAEV